MSQSSKRRRDLRKKRSGGKGGIARADEWDGVLYSGRPDLLSPALEVLWSITLQPTETLESLARDLFAEESDFDLDLLEPDGLRGFLVDVGHLLQSQEIDTLVTSFQAAFIESVATENPHLSRFEVLSEVHDALLEILQGQCYRENPEVFAAALYWFLTDPTVSEEPLHFVMVLAGAVLVNYYDDDEEDWEDEDLEGIDRPESHLN